MAEPELVVTVNGASAKVRSAECISQCITSSQCTTAKKPRLRNLAEPGFFLSGGPGIEPRDPELGKVMLRSGHPAHPSRSRQGSENRSARRSCRTGQCARAFRP